jgi:hypothetical protein
MCASDDLLQCEGCYGGRKVAGEDLFSFTYFPGAAPTIKRKWIFEITSAEIARVAAGKMTSLNLWACANPNCGSMFPSSKHRCFYCDYVDDNPRRMPPGVHSSRRNWALEYFAMNPSAHPMLMIGDFNGTDLCKMLGYFTLSEAQAIKGRSRSRG